MEAQRQYVCGYVSVGGVHIQPKHWVPRHEIRYLAIGVHFFPKVYFCILWGCKVVLAGLFEFRFSLSYKCMVLKKKKENMEA